jgi:transcriptional regulator with XRE-family HTH domain
MNEKAEFSQRLKTALKGAGVRTASSTKLAIDFNLHHQGKPITTQAAHKWLNGNAIPSQDKLRTLAVWLNVSSEWLRYGAADKKPETQLRQNIPPYLTLEEQLLIDFQRLNDANQAVVREMAAMLLRQQSQPAD